MIRVTPHRGGWLEVICGPMFSGKSEEMIRRLRRAEIAGQRVVIFKPRIDDRYDVDDVVSHAGIRMRGVPVGSVAELLARATGHDVVGIDEVQFFEPAIVGATLSLAERRRRVVAAGLDQDFRRLPFGPMPELLAHAEFVDKLQAVCHRCGGPATTTQRLVDGGRPRTEATRSSSARPSSTRPAAAAATSLAQTPSPSQPDLRPISATTELPTRPAASTGRVADVLLRNDATRRSRSAPKGRSLAPAPRCDRPRRPHRREPRPAWPPQRSRPATVPRRGSMSGGGRR